MKKYIVGKRMKISRDGELIWVNPGDPVPEAEFWPNLNAWIRQKYVREVNRYSPPGGAVDVSVKKSPSLSRPPEPRNPPAPMNKEDEDLRDLYLSAPGITEKNVDAVLSTWESVVELDAAGCEKDLIALGVSSTICNCHFPIFNLQSVCSNVRPNSSEKPNDAGNRNTQQGSAQGDGRGRISDSAGGGILHRKGFSIQRQ